MARISSTTVPSTYRQVATGAISSTVELPDGTRALHCENAGTLDVTMGDDAIDGFPVFPGLNLGAFTALRGGDAGKVYAAV